MFGLKKLGKFGWVTWVMDRPKATYEPVMKDTSGIPWTEQYELPPLCDRWDYFKLVTVNLRGEIITSQELKVGYFTEDLQQF